MLELTEQTVKQLALSRNHENAGDEKQAYMSIAYTEIELNEAQIDGLMGPCTYRSWFNINGKDIQPMDWTKKVSLGCEDKFKDVSVSMKLGKKELEFDGCRLYVDRFKLVSGGGVLTDLHVHVLKAKDGEWTLIGQHEFTEVKLSIGDGVVIERKARKQRQLPFDADPNADKDDETSEGESGHPPLTGAHLPGADTTHIWWQHGINGEQWQGARCDMPEGCVEIDPPAGSKSELEQAAERVAAGAGDGSPEDLAAFENGVANAVGARKKRGSNVIDGRSERVKHQDSQQSGKH